MDLVKRITQVTLVSLPIVVVDQATKALASEYLPRGEWFSSLLDTLRVGYAENTGAFLGLGGSLSPELRFWLFVVGVGAFLLLIAGYLLFAKSQTTASVVGLSLLLSGGLSNFYDRVMNNGAVIDFLNVGIGTIRTGIFNAADMAIMAGLVVLFLESVMVQRRNGGNQ